MATVPLTTTHAIPNFVLQNQQKSAWIGPNFNMSPSAIGLHEHLGVSHAQEDGWADRDEMRTAFTLAMSAMYKEEVPLYSTLGRIVSDVNVSVMAGDMDPRVLAMRFGDVSPSRLDVERHGAIRLGSAYELQTIYRMFNVLGMCPVGYYDLSEAGLPMHATCFRPITRRALRKNPFRVFTSVLRPELIKDPRARSLAIELLSRRNIFSDDLLRLLDIASQQAGRLTHEQSNLFVVEALKTFQWKGTSIATPEEYACLKAEHPVLADITCFATSHINHLTPRTLDITKAQEAMEEEGMQVKDRIEGPPPRACPVLLRQTSFLAIEETIKFRNLGSPHIPHQFLSTDIFGPKGHHRARFGEIEERGAAVTAAGRALYDKLFEQAMIVAQRRQQTASEEESQMEARKAYDRILAHVFQEFPDDWESLRRHGLVYFNYHCVGREDEHRNITQTAMTSQTLIGGTGELPTIHLDLLLSNGIVEAVPITYEDFLPLSAAGIFQSNLGPVSTPPSSPPQEGNGSGLNASTGGRPDPEGMERAMQGRLLDPDFMYKFLERKSIIECAGVLGVKIVF